MSKLISVEAKKLRSPLRSTSHIGSFANSSLAAEAAKLPELTQDQKDCFYDYTDPDVDLYLRKLGFLPDPVSVREDRKNLLKIGVYLETLNNSSDSALTKEVISPAVKKFNENYDKEKMDAMGKRYLELAKTWESPTDQSHYIYMFLEERILRSRPVENDTEADLLDYFRCALKYVGKTDGSYRGEAHVRNAVNSGSLMSPKNASILSSFSDNAAICFLPGFKNSSAKSAQIIEALIILAFGKDKLTNENAGIIPSSSLDQSWTEDDRHLLGLYFFYEMFNVAKNHQKDIFGAGCRLLVEFPHGTCGPGKALEQVIREARSDSELFGKYGNTFWYFFKVPEDNSVDIDRMSPPQVPLDCVRPFDRSSKWFFEVPCSKSKELLDENGSAIYVDYEYRKILEEFRNNQLTQTQYVLLLMKRMVGGEAGWWRLATLIEAKKYEIELKGEKARGLPEAVLGAKFLEVLEEHVRIIVKEKSGKREIGTSLQSFISKYLLNLVRKAKKNAPTGD